MTVDEAVKEIIDGVPTTINKVTEEKKEPSNETPKKEDYNELIKKEVTPTISEKKPIDSLTYEIIGGTQQSGINSRGYTEKYIDGKYSLVITMGKKSTGGNSISITKVNINGDNVTIYVTEKIPGPKDPPAPFISILSKIKMFELFVIPISSKVKL